MLPPLETPTGCHVDAVKLKLSSLRDRPQMPHVDVVKSYSFFSFPTLQEKRDSRVGAWGLLAGNFSLLDSRLFADFDTLFVKLKNS
jgi:hypothetical protein